MNWFSLYARFTPHLLSLSIHANAALIDQRAPTRTNRFLHLQLLAYAIFPLLAPVQLLRHAVETALHASAARQGGVRYVIAAVCGQMAAERENLAVGVPLWEVDLERVERDTTLRAVRGTREWWLQTAGRTLLVVYAALSGFLLWMYVRGCVETGGEGVPMFDHRVGLTALGACVSSVLALALAAGDAVWWLREGKRAGHGGDRAWEDWLAEVFAAACAHDVAWVWASGTGLSCGLLAVVYCLLNPATWLVGVMAAALFGRHVARWAERFEDMSARQAVVRCVAVVVAGYCVMVFVLQAGVEWAQFRGTSANPGNVVPVPVPMTSIWSSAMFRSSLGWK